jgi:hypothetical protein
MDILYFLLTGLALFAIVADYITTIKAMDKGGYEGNPINRWLFKKIGPAFTTFIEAVFFLIVSAALFQAAGIGYSAGYSGFIASLESYMAIRNYLLFVRK